MLSSECQNCPACIFGCHAELENFEDEEASSGRSNDRGGQDRTDLCNADG
jgi:hypothetical protein